MTRKPKSIEHSELAVTALNMMQQNSITQLVAMDGPRVVGFVHLHDLLKEGFSEVNNSPYSADNPKIYRCGDVMFDNSLHFSKLADNKSEILTSNGLEKNKFILATIHRNNNTDDKVRLNSIFSALDKICDKHHTKVFLPLHPRTAIILL